MGHPDPTPPASGTGGVSPGSGNPGRERRFVHRQSDTRRKLGFSNFIVIAALAVGCLLPAAAAAPRDSVPVLPVFRAEALAPWVRAAGRSRVDMVGIGDSNQAFGGHGWDHGCGRALASRFGLFATGLHSAGENLGQGQGLGYRCSILSTACCVPQFAYTGAPGPWDGCMSADVWMYPMNYVYLAAGQAAGGTSNLGLQLDADHPIGVNQRLGYEVSYGLGPVAGGTLTPTIRLGQSPYSNLVSTATVSTFSPNWGWTVATAEMPAGNRNAALNGRFTPWGQNLTGPVALFTQRFINLDRANGTAFTSLYSRGSQSARDMALGVLSASDDQLTMFFSLLRSRQGATRGTLVRISTGLNDMNEPLGSLGPAQIADGSSPEAYADNIRAIIDRLRGVWTLNNWPEGELYFLIAVSHPISAPDDARLIAYRQAAESVATSVPRCAVSRFDLLTDASEMLVQGWYQSGGADRFHLTQAAYETLATRELDAVVAGACRQDINADGVVNTADLTRFLGAFGTGVSPGTRGDVNADGVVNVVDLTAFLGVFGTSCP
jgi:lysophospholipase L1-like esterase